MLFYDIHQLSKLFLLMQVGLVEKPVQELSVSLDELYIGTLSSIEVSRGRTLFKYVFKSSFSIKLLIAILSEGFEDSVVIKHTLSFRRAFHLLFVFLTPINELITFFVLHHPLLFKLLLGHEPIANDSHVCAVKWTVPFFVHVLVECIDSPFKLGVIITITKNFLVLRLRKCIGCDALKVIAKKS